MAKVIIGAEVKVGGLDKAGQSVGTLKKQIKDATNELHTMAATFGETSTQALEAAKKVALLKDRVQNAAETAALFDPGKKFAVFGNVINTVTGGFSALTGAMGLFGDKSSDVEKVLLKVQSAMLFQQGLSAIADASKHFTRLGAIIKSTTIFQQANNAATEIAVVVQKAFGASVIGTGRAFNILKGAIISTGIGALVVLIGVVISKIIDWTSSNEDLEKSQESLKKAIDATTAATDRHRHAASNATAEALALAKAQGKSQEELFKIAQKGALEDERLQGVKLRALYAFYEKQKELFEKGKIDEQVFLDAKRKYLDAYQQYEDFKSQQRINKYNEENRIREQRIADAKKAAEEFKKQQEEAKKLAKERKAFEDWIKPDRGALLADLQNYGKEVNAEEARQEQAHIDRLKANKQQELKTKAQLAELAVLNDPDSIENKIAKIKADLALELSALAEGDLQRQILTKQANAEEARLVQAHSDAIVQVKKDEAEAKKQIAQDEFNFQMTIAEGIANSLDTLAGIAGKQTAAGKALAIASTVIKTIQGGIAAFTGMVSSIPGPVGIALGAVAAAGVVASGVKAVKQITAVKVPGASGGGGAPSISLPGAPIKPQAQTTTLDQQSINAVGNASNRAYVLETDVTNNQDRITRLNRAARIN